MTIEVHTPHEDELATLGVTTWGIWESDVREFDWEYDSDERAYIIEGAVVVTPENGEPVTIQKGDLVRFPKGMKCHWKVTEQLQKYYRFEQ